MCLHSGWRWSSTCAQTAPAAANPDKKAQANVWEVVSREIWSLPSSPLGQHRWTDCLQEQKLKQVPSFMSCWALQGTLFPNAQQQQMEFVLCISRAAAGEAGKGGAASKECWGALPCQNSTMGGELWLFAPGWVKWRLEGTTDTNTVPRVKCQGLQVRGGRSSLAALLLSEHHSHQ